jgi:uncharacterized membrane protein
MRRLPLWTIIIPLLALANAAYLLNNIIGWALTLGFFLLAPGYLLLAQFKLKLESRWETAAFSMGLSILLLMLTGLALNSLHAFGLARPLTTPNVFAALDIVTLALLGVNLKKSFPLAVPILRLSYLEMAACTILTLLPLLAIGGAIRINNGASNVLTMTVFAIVPVTLVLLVWRKDLARIYPYAAFCIALAVLFSTSLRGWYVTGHDIQHEFRVFYGTNHNAWWKVGNSGDPYNACLSITILPTIIAKITTISLPYVFKVVFQLVFALGVLPIYFLVKRIKNPTLALLNAFVFISFPAFLDDMPFINRQEMAFVFFGLMLSATFLKMSQKSKIVLTMLLIFGLILSHYSSGYTMLLLLLFSWAVFKVLNLRFHLHEAKLPLLQPSIILSAILFTFLWNAQVTASTSNLRESASKTLHSLVGKDTHQDGFVQQYSLFGSSSHGNTVAESLTRYAGNQAGNVQYVAWQTLPITSFGKTVSTVIDVGQLNSMLHSSVAKVFQVLLLLGAALLIVRSRKSASQTELYFVSLVISCLALLALWAVLPQVSVDYTVIRLFQQTLAITALPIVLGAELLVFFAGRYKAHLATAFFGLVFLDLSGFIPQSLGGYLPQLSLNNAGVYYDYFYSQGSDIISSQWIAEHHNANEPVAMDTNSATTIENYWISEGLGGMTVDYAYIYQGAINTQRHIYRVFLGSGMVEFTDPKLTAGRNLLYTSSKDNIYGGRP